MSVAEQQRLGMSLRRYQIYWRFPNVRNNADWSWWGGYAKETTRDRQIERIRTMDWRRGPGGIVTGLVYPVEVRIRDRTLGTEEIMQIDGPSEAIIRKE